MNQEQRQVDMKVGGRLKLEGELTVVPANEVKELDCDTCQHPLSFDDNGVLVCRACRPL